MKEASTFQTILLVVFGVGAIIGVIVFAMYRAGGGAVGAIPPLQMWGTLPASHFDFLIDRPENPIFQRITYREIRPEDFDRTLVEAIADGEGPDLVVLRHDSIHEHRNRIVNIPFESVSSSVFNSTYLSAGTIFQGEMGYYALPALIDPLVMYWNRTMLAENGMTAPPATWDLMRDFSQRITQTDGFLEITRSAVSLGTFDNINHAKDLISLLLMQAGSRITARGATGYVADFSQQSRELSLPPAEAINFYLEFADPARRSYSWNAAMPASREAFVAEDLALYFGFASEEREIIEANPHLSFGVSLMPQVASSSAVMTTGDIYGIAVLRSSQNVNPAFHALFALTGGEGISALDTRTGLPSVRLDLLREDPARASSTIFVNSALVVRTWFDPDPIETERAFRNMIQSIRANELSTSDALGRLGSQINELFR
jgi:multiple sugar transport system substrate-binding protein